MGGAAFPTGMKWDLVRKQEASPKYVICNADESEPGTFKDRVILSDLAHLVIEGMMLAGRAVAAEKGIVFIRHEYGPERQIVQQAIDDARALGLLGENIQGSGLNFDIDVAVSPGGYIMGEETALLECLEDKRGEPRNKPPFPGVSGLWGKPTVINNVETLAFVPIILSHGPQWWGEQGVGKAAGLKFVAVSGHVKRPGVYLAPMGTVIREIIELAGGMAEGVRPKAILPGGASSNFLPAEKIDTHYDFQSLQEAGSMLGSGALIVIGEDVSMLELATNVVRFFRNESCGKCVPCRQGSEKGVIILEQFSAGHQDIELEILPDLAETMNQSSICGLGQVALNPILSAMEHFPKEIESPGASS
jgi:NADH:ubiquinone oxidoreductase subunit F (NADH-binding)